MKQVVTLTPSRTDKRGGGQKLKGRFCTQKQCLKVRFKDFQYIQIKYRIGMNNFEKHLKQKRFLRIAKVWNRVTSYFASFLYEVSFSLLYQSIYIDLYLLPSIHRKVRTISSIKLPVLLSTTLSIQIFIYYQVYIERLGL